MALSKTVNFKGISVDAYIRIINVEGDKNRMVCTVGYFSAPTETRFDAKTVEEFDFDINSEHDIYKQAYEYLKTLPEFADAVDA
jgi:hypothetical protein